MCARFALVCHGMAASQIAALWTSYSDHGGCGIETLLRIDVCTCGRARRTFRKRLFRAASKETVRLSAIVSRQRSCRWRTSPITAAIRSASSCTGWSRSMRDQSSCRKPRSGLLERNLIRFVAQRPELKKLGMPTKKGLLMYGPPGTGKTHTIRFLASSAERPHGSARDGRAARQHQSVHRARSIVAAERRGDRRRRPDRPRAGRNGNRPRVAPQSAAQRNGRPAGGRGDSVSVDHEPPRMRWSERSPPVRVASIRPSSSRSPMKPAAASSCGSTLPVQRSRTM